MTWMKFTLWLLGIYLPYYAILIFLDHLLDRKNPGAETGHELTFAEYIEPVRVAPGPAAEAFSSAVVSSGGVSLKQLYDLAKDGAIAYKHSL